MTWTEGRRIRSAEQRPLRLRRGPRRSAIHRRRPHSDGIGPGERSPPFAADVLAQLIARPRRTGCPSMWDTAAPAANEVDRSASASPAGHRVCRGGPALASAGELGSPGGGGPDLLVAHADRTGE